MEASPTRRSSISASSTSPIAASSRGFAWRSKYFDWQVFDNPTLPSDDLDQFRAIVNYAVPLL